MSLRHFFRLNLARQGHAPFSAAIAAISFALTALPVAAQELVTLEADCKDGEVCVERSTGLPLKVLPRPFSHIYKEKSATPETIYAENIRSFFPLFVFSRDGVDLSNPTDPLGWYEVGASEVAPTGWMQAKDVLEWRQALIVAYTNPESRKPVLGFKDRQTLIDIVEGGDRVAAANARYEQLAAAQKPDGVITSEPKGAFLDIDEDFYVLPVLDFERTEDVPPIRYLQLVAAVPGERAGTPEESTVDSPEFRAEVAGSSPVYRSEGADRLNIDIVFVMDLTESMEPFVGYTLDAIKNLQLKLTEKAAKNIRFGFVGYRDDIKAVPDMEYTARNYTPTLLDANQFSSLLGSEVKAAKAGSGDYQEEVFAGMKEAINSNWSSGSSARFIVLVGDASSHAIGHPQNTTGLDAQGIRRLAEENNVYVMAMHLQDQEDEVDWPYAVEQFSTMARNPGRESADLLPVNARDPNAYLDATTGIVKVFNAIFDARGVLAGDAEAVEDIDTGATSAAGKAGEKLAKGVAKAALVDVFGDDAKAQRDVTFWASDRDLLDLSRQALDVRVLLTRRQLNDLIIAVEQIYVALKDNELTEIGFITTLRNVVTKSVSDSDDIKVDSASDVTPSWLAKLPYKSKVQSLSDAQYESYTPEERANLQENLEGLMSLYKEIYASDKWVALNETDPDLRHVYPLPLSLLP